MELAAEIVIFDSKVRNLLDKNRFNEVRPYLKSKGWMSIKDVGILKVKRGLVDPEEMFLKQTNTFQDFQLDNN